jgi:ribose transport system substrate-binding protein
VLISDNRKSYFWKSVYEGAKDALNENSYIEMLGNNLSMEYSTADLMRIAINSKVDGIILEADESAEITELINEANDADIPVITAVNDNNTSTRKSFVGVNSYNLGLAYGQQVCNIEKNPPDQQVIN